MKMAGFTWHAHHVEQQASGQTGQHLGCGPTGVVYTRKLTVVLGGSTPIKGRPCSRIQMKS